MGYLSANFSLPRPLCSRLRPDVHDRQTSDFRHASSLNAPTLGAGHNNKNKLCGRPPQNAPAPCKLTFDLLTLKVVSESHVTWATFVPILVFLDLSVLDLGPMYATDRRQTDVRRASSLNASALWGRGIIIITSCRRAAATICPRFSPPSVGAEASRAAEPTAAPADRNVAVGSHGEYFPTLTAAAD